MARQSRVNADMKILLEKAQIYLMLKSTTELLLKDLNRNPSVFLDLRCFPQNLVATHSEFYVLFEWFISEEPSNPGSLIQDSKPIDIHEFDKGLSLDEVKKLIYSKFPNTEIYYELAQTYDSIDRNAKRSFNNTYDFFDTNMIDWDAPCKNGDELIYFNFKT